MEDFISRETFDAKMETLDKENDRQNHRISKLEESFEVVNRLATNIERLAVQIENMQTELKRQGAHLDRIEEEPSDNWKNLTKTVITAIASAVVAYFLAKGGLL